MDDQAVRNQAGRDRLTALLDVLLASIDDPAPGLELARRAHLSRFHFDRLVKAALGEAPAAFRRRLLLERAAFELAAGERSVTELALEAGYGSSQTFARAFSRAFGVTPSVFRTGGAADFRLSAQNGVHFHPPGGLLVPGDDSRRSSMDLTDRLVAHDNSITQQLLERASELPDEALDEPVRLEPRTVAFQGATPSLRSMLDRLVFTKEMWSAAIGGRSFEESDDTSLAGMHARIEQAGEEFADLVRDIRTRGAWDTAFVDATCDPPESFTFGGAVAHALTWNAYRHAVVAGVLRAQGVQVSADPLHSGLFG